ncbi:MAG: hypothetical protein RI897_4551, partial [Verrucomicrobiota bacterium]
MKGLRKLQRRLDAMGLRQARRFVVFLL